jgi:hypothetical protein
MVAYDRGNHILAFDLDRERVMADIVAFLTEGSTPRGPLDQTLRGSPCGGEGGTSYVRRSDFPLPGAGRIAKRNPPFTPRDCRIRGIDPICLRRFALVLRRKSTYNG